MLTDASWSESNSRQFIDVSPYLAPDREQQYDMLMPGGVLLIADVVQPATRQGVEAAARIWDDSVRQRSVSLSGDLRGWEAFQRDRWNLYRFPNAMDKPSGVFAQLKWLEGAGFDPVDVFWLKAGHAIYGGQRAK